MTRRRIILVLPAAVLLCALLLWLRDPPWLLTSSSGLRGWETEAGGGRYRWMTPHASFFVPSGARTIEIPLRAGYEAPPGWPIVATVTLDDRPVDRLDITGSAWRRTVVRMPPPGNRHVRRIDIRLTRTQDFDRSAQIGEVVQR